MKQYNLTAQDLSMLLCRIARIRAEKIVFTDLHKWDAIPESFLTVAEQIEKGNIEGEYALTLCQKTPEKRYIAGCKIKFSQADGFVISQIKCKAPPFEKLMLDAQVWIKEQKQP